MERHTSDAMRLGLGDVRHGCVWLEWIWVMKGLLWDAIDGSPAGLYGLAAPFMKKGLTSFHLVSENVWCGGEEGLIDSARQTARLVPPAPAHPRSRAQLDDITSRNRC